MSVYRCNGCGYIAEMGGEAVGTEAKCPKCGRDNKVYDTVLYLRTVLKRYFALRAANKALQARLDAADATGHVTVQTPTPNAASANAQSVGDDAQGPEADGRAQRLPGDDFRQLLGKDDRQPACSAQNQGRPTAPGRPVQGLLTAVALMAEAKRLGAKQAGWPEIFDSLNPSQDKRVADLLIAVRGPHMFAPGVAMRVVQAGCEYALRSNERADSVAALQAAQSGVDRVADSERH